MGIIKPGYFSENAEADKLRFVFDSKNLTILQNNIDVDFLFIGDSITQMWELNAYYKNSDKCIINRGISGDRTTYLNRRFEADCVQLKPKVCVCMVGVNDAWDFEFDVWNLLAGASLETVLSRAEKNLTEIVEKATSNGVKMILGTTLPTAMVHTNAEDLRNQYVLKLNEFIRKLCSEKSIACVDYFKLFEKDNKADKSLLIEGLHPNGFGYNLMFDELNKTLISAGCPIL